MTKNKLHDTSTYLLRGRLSGPQCLRLKSLLDMMYTPAELAQEIGFSKRQVYRAYLPLGCPHEKDENGHIWINGKLFAAWCAQVYIKPKLKEGETFCMTCKRAVLIVEPVKEQKGNLVYLLSTCPNCGRKLSRIIEKRRVGRD